jgi:hypothetical protein
MQEADGGFTIAVVRPDDPFGTRVDFTRYGADAVPDDLLDLRHTPGTREFDVDEAERQVRERGYKMTTGWQWAGTDWIAVVQLIRE